MRIFPPAVPRVQQALGLRGIVQGINRRSPMMKQVVKEATPNPFAVTPAFFIKEKSAGVALAEDVLCEHIREFKKP